MSQSCKLLLLIDISTAHFNCLSVLKLQVIEIDSLVLLQEMLDEAQKAKIYENLRRFENPVVLELCGTLFAEKRKSIWSGPHSITGHQGSSRLDAAFASFMK